jgi:hypothetical protein
VKVIKENFTEFVSIDVIIDMMLSRDKIKVMNKHYWCSGVWQYGPACVVLSQHFHDVTEHVD